MSDVPTELLVVVDAGKAAGVLAELRAAGVVMQALEPRLALIREDPSSLRAAERLPGVRIFREEPDAAEPLTAGERLFVAAWASRSVPKHRPGDGLAWDSPGYDPPDAREDRRA